MRTTAILLVDDHPENLVALGHRSSAPKNRFHTQHELRRTERLGEVIVSAK